MFSYLERAVNWLKAGYPQGIPSGDYIPLVALLRRRLTEDEVVQLGLRLEEKGLVPADHVDVGSGYIKITDEVPSEQELKRVTDKLEQAGWPIEDPAWRERADEA